MNRKKSTKKKKTVKREKNVKKEIARHIDHTNIDPNATKAQIIKTCDEAKYFGFRGVCVNPEWTGLTAKELLKSNIETIVLIDPPMGQSSHLQRVRLCEAAKRHGADELDIVVNVVDIKYGRQNRVLDDLKEICQILPTKVIIGSGYLTDNEIEDVSRIVKKAGAFCVKTSTFKDPLDHFELGEKARHIQIMKKAAKSLKIKAAGKIRTFEDLKLMLDAGADIIGTSSSLRIIEEVGKKIGE